MITSEQVAEFSKSPSLHIFVYWTIMSWLHIVFLFVRLYYWIKCLNPPTLNKGGYSDLKAVAKVLSASLLTSGTIHCLQNGVRSSEGLAIKVANDDDEMPHANFATRKETFILQHWVVGWCFRLFKLNSCLKLETFDTTSRSSHFILGWENAVLIAFPSE